MKTSWKCVEALVSVSIHQDFIRHNLAMIPSSKFQHKPRLIAQYLQILAIDGFLSFGSLVSVWAYMWLMLESASFCNLVLPFYFIVPISQPPPKNGSFLGKGTKNSLISMKSRLVKYYNLARYHQLQLQLQRALEVKKVVAALGLSWLFVIKKGKE